MECSDPLAGPHEQGIGGIGTMGSSPMPPMVPMVYRNAKVGHEPSTLRPDRGDRLCCDRGLAVGARRSRLSL